MSSTGRHPRPRPSAPVPPKTGAAVEVSEQYGEHLGMNDAKDRGKGRLNSFAQYLEQEWGMKWLAVFIRGHTNLIWRVAQVAAVLLPLIPSIILLVFVTAHRTFGGYFAQIVIWDLPDAQVVVSIIASTLTYFNVLTISSLLSAVGIDIEDNFVFAWLLSNIGFDKQRSDKQTGTDEEGEGQTDGLDAPTVSKFLFGGRFSFRELIVGCICFALLYAPHVIWIGTLTPNVATKQLAATRADIIPKYSPETASYWADNGRFGNSNACLAKDFPPATTLDSCPASGGSSSIFDSMTQASEIVWKALPHYAVDDDSLVPYIGRSFGVGAGSDQDVLGEYDTHQGEPEGRDYEEAGYSTEVVCSYNTSLTVNLTRLEVDVPSKIPLNSMYEVTGNLPNGSAVGHNQVITADKDGDAVAWVTSSTEQGHSLAIAVAGGFYSDLHHIQCGITFVPTLFSITQNYDTSTTSSNVTVKFASQNDFHGMAPLKQTGLERTAVIQLGILSHLQSSPYASELGSALASNIAARYRLNGGKDGSRDTLLLTAVAESIAVAMDDILLYVGRSQLALAATQPTSAQSVEFVPRVQRVQIGTLKWTILAVIMTGVLSIASVVRLAFFIKAKKNGTYYRDKKERQRLLAKSVNKTSHV